VHYDESSQDWGSAAVAVRSVKIVAFPSDVRALEVAAVARVSRKLSTMLLRAMSPNRSFGIIWARLPSG
jgi:hypothetical protein